MEDALDALFLVLFELVLPFGRPRPGVDIIADVAVTDGYKSLCSLSSPIL